MKKEEKVRVITELQEKFSKATGLIFTDYRGLTVEEISDLRKKLREHSFEYRVVKNTLAKRAAVETPVNAAKEMFKGPVGVAFGYGDPVMLAKQMLEFSKANEKLQIKGGMVEGGVCNAAQIKTISELPSREVQLSMLIGAMQSPVSKLARLLNASVAQIIYAMEALKTKRDS
ncbi:MAG: 50S ribosomal protein L10 [Nitrospirae bacterium]|nr:50S ribosomal protein L10 [Nitrospirota bacterium]